MFGSKTVVHPMKAGYRMKLDLRVGEQNAAFHSGEYDPDDMALLFERATPGAVMLDIGANVGFYSCAFAQHLKSREWAGRVFGFEPVMSNYERTLENVALNGFESIVTVTRTALGTAPGELVMHIVPGGEANNSVGDNMLAEGSRRDTADWRKDVAPVVRLDDWAAEVGLDRCDLIKIDVEGAEPLVFEGGRKLLERFRPVILGEFNPFWMGEIGRTFADVRAFFEPMGYRIARIVDGVARPYDDSLEARPGEVPSYLLIP